MGLSNHHRALVSNLGEGNWGIGSSTDNQLDANGVSVYFPPGASKGTAPAPGDSNAGPMSSLDLSGWGTKSNWVVQLNVTDRGTPPSGTNVAITVKAYRPTGVSETVLEVVGNELPASATYPLPFSYGGYESEKICGPVSYFEFTTSGFTGNPSIDCFVIGWNEGDMCYGLGES